MTKPTQKTIHDFSTYLPDAIADLSALVKIDSSQSAPEKNAPFGIGARKCLDYMLKKSAGLNFICSDVDGYAGYAELKSQNPAAETLGVLTHLDVVPLGEGWIHAQGEVSDGKIWGRGATDNKGPTIACLYALKKIAEKNLSLKRNIRLIWGCNEESGSACMDYYSKHQPAPDIGFSPDADFPVITFEKTILHLKASAPANCAELLSWTAGTVINAVPAKSELHLSRKLANAASTLLDKSNNLGIYKILPDGSIKITSTGISTHAMCPEKGDNAAWKSAEILATLLKNDCPEAISSAYKTLCNFNALKNLSLYCCDADSGEQTMNIGKVEYKNGMLSLYLDFRCPKSQNLENLKARIASVMPKTDLSVLYHAPCKDADKDGELVKGLCRVYTRVSGKPAECLIIGGGTYARKFDNCVAFGPLKAGETNNMHNIDEYLELTEFEMLMHMYYEAMVELATEK